MSYAAKKKAHGAQRKWRAAKNKFDHHQYGYHTSTIIITLTYIDDTDTDTYVYSYTHDSRSWSVVSSTMRMSTLSTTPRRMCASRFWNAV